MAIHPLRVLAITTALAVSIPSATVIGATATVLDATAIPAEIRAYPIHKFRIGSDETKFGRFEFAGGMELRSPLEHFGSMSGFRFLDQGHRFIGVTDSGFWYFGSVSRDALGAPTGFSGFSMQPIVGANGQVIGEKWYTDAEGLAVRGGEATVGFEREHRISTYVIKPGEMGAETGRLDFLVPERELRRNKGFETIAYAPEDSPLQGARIAITERSIDTKGNIFAAVLEGPRKGIFKVVRHGTFDVTGGTFLADGSLLLLERSFTMAEGVKMRLRLIDTATIARGKTVDGDVLLEADLNYQIDNMEGIDSWVDSQGRQRISIVSDDNHSILQRNLYLEFILME